MSSPAGPITTSHDRSVRCNGGLADSDIAAQRALDLIDPVRGLSIPSLRKTGAELRAEAEAAWDFRLHRAAAVARTRLSITRVRQDRHALRRTFTLVFVALLALILQPVVEAQAEQVPATLPTSVDQDYRPHLAALIDRLVPDLPIAPAGPTYIHVRRWSIDTVAGPTIGMITVQDVQTWWKADHSAKHVVTTLPPEPAGTTRSAYIETVPASAASETTNYPPGGYATVTDQPADTAAALARQLNQYEPAANGPQAVVHGITALAQYHRLSMKQRIAALTLLGTVPQLRYRGDVTDRAGRKGVAFSLDSSGHIKIRDLLIFDRTSGVLLEHDRIALSVDPGHPTVPTPATTAYTLYL